MENNIKALFTNKWKHDISVLYPKLRTYATFKLTFCIEPYLLLLKNLKEVSALARFRLSSHSLQIELGRHNNTPINDRLCTRSDYNAVHDEEHFLIHCSFFNEERDVLFHEANNYIENFNTLSFNFKFVSLLNCQEYCIIKLVTKHVRLCLNKTEA